MKLFHGGFLLFLLVVITSSTYESTIAWPQNIETHYPYTYPPVTDSPAAISPPLPPPPPPPPPPPSQTRSRTSNKKIVAAVGATAATTFVAVGLLFLFWSKYNSRDPSRRGSYNERPPTLSTGAVASAGSRSEFTRLGGKIKGFIVDEDGLDVIYWRNLKSNTNNQSRSSTFDVAVSSRGGGQPPPAPLPPEKKMEIPRIQPPPPHSSRRGSGSSLSSLSSGGIKTLERGSSHSSNLSGNRYNGDMMEAMFGVMATNRKSPIKENPNAKIFILDPQGSKSTSTVLESLGVPLGELIEFLLKGKGMSIGALEKLVRIAPTRKEESEIMAFDGDPTRLADAELFCYRLLKAVPSAFARANAMLFKLRYESEIGTFKESLRTLESACNELRSSDAVLKLLEAILNAGIQLNGGSTAGDVKAFGLRKLLKLSDYKSSDGKTTLLHFVVHKVVRNEGRRCALARNNSRNRNYDTNPATQLNDPVVKAEKEREFLRMGLPIVGGLSSNFTYVRKAACLDYRALRSSLVSLRTRVDEMGRLVTEYRSSRGGDGYVKEIERIQDSAEAEMKAIKEERTRVMDYVKRAAQHYQAADASDGHPLQLFVDVKDFLGMVDQACVEIAQSLQEKQPTTAVSRPGSSQPDVLRTRVTFPRLPDHFLSDKSSANTG